MELGEGRRVGGTELYISFYRQKYKQVVLLKESQLITCVFCL